jgi:hypothetical protein
MARHLPLSGPLMIFQLLSHAFILLSWTIVYNSLWVSSGLSLSWLSGNTEYSLPFSLSSLITCIGRSFARY